jgi:hypothetical protein
MRVLGATATVTLMACYGAMYEPIDCEASGTCGCTVDEDCAAGSYCADPPSAGGLGTCTWSGTCTGPDQCNPGMTCDLPRQTCVPGCAQDGDCYYGEVCDLASATCVPGAYCGYDGAACGVGMRCDPLQGVCVPCTGAACGSCTEEATCGDSPPACPEGTVPAVEAGCYTAACIEVAACIAAACAPLDEAACVASETCAPAYTGIDCTDPEGDPCDDTTATCTCTSFEFAGCAGVPPP